MKKEFTTPKEILTHIRNVYASCDTFDEIKEKGLDKYICNSAEYIFGKKRGHTKIELINKTKETIQKNKNLARSNNDLYHGGASFWFINYSIEQNREKECIQLKVDFLNKLIEML